MRGSLLQFAMPLHLDPPITKPPGIHRSQQRHVSTWLLFQPEGLNCALEKTRLFSFARWGDRGEDWLDSLRIFLCPKGLIFLQQLLGPGRNSQVIPRVRLEAIDQPMR